MSGCGVRHCASPQARTGGCCDGCWDGRGGVLAYIPELWVRGHNVLPPGSHGLQEAVGGHVPGSRSPVSDFALETLHGTATELAEWANVALRVRGLEPLRREGKRWGVLLDCAVAHLGACDEAFRYSPLAAEYVGDLLRLQSRLKLLAGLDTLVHKLPAPCGKCNRVGLLRHNGKEVVVCSNCGGKWPETEYRKHVLVLARRYADANIRSPKGGAP